MIKNPTTDKPDIEEKEKQQSKRKKRKTLCIDKRRGYGNCSICGSESIIEQGVRFCENCGIESEYISAELFHRFTYLCDCHWKHKSYISVKKCVTCGSVESKTCPACKGRCWTYKMDNIKYCKICGYRS